MKRFLASLLLLTSAVFAQQTATTSTPLEPGQIYSTGNIVQPTTTTSGSTWVNGVYQDQLTCWGWGDPGYCGPNPVVRPGGNINFSFGTTDLYQVQAIASVLPGSGSGLRVNGYNFGFTAKNGNGWDGGGLDSLSAYVNFYGSDGKSVRNDYYDLNWKFDWTTFNYSKTFDSPYAAKDLSTVQYGFVGRDNNFWAGPYGPEITNVNFSLKYSVDPCATNPLYSPTCPGYMDALNKLLPPPILIEPATTAPAVSEPVIMIAPTTAVVSTASTTQTNTVAPVVSTLSPAATTSAAGSTANTRENGGANTAQALSIISRNQERDRETLAIAQSATAAATAAASAAQQEAVAVATSAVANSVGSTVLGATANNSGSGIRSSATVNNILSQTSAFQILSGMSTSLANILQMQSTVSSTAGTASTTETVSVHSSAVITTGAGSNATESNTSLPSNFLIDRTNPINTAIETRPQLPAGAANIGPSVNTRVADNEAAGGVSIATMAVAPTGYGDYLNFTLRDSAFYAPREVYRNQRTVDNARALRQLTNDGRHREMVEQQYKRN